MKIYLLDDTRCKVPPSFFDDDMNEESPISMCLPSKRGRGLCALKITEYLIDKQNDILLKCRELVKVKPRLGK